MLAIWWKAIAGVASDASSRLKKASPPLPRSAAVGRPAGLGRPHGNVSRRRYVTFGWTPAENVRSVSTLSFGARPPGPLGSHGKRMIHALAETGMRNFEAKRNGELGMFLTKINFT